MASIIDGSTYAGFWKITPDDSSPDTYRLAEKKSGIIFKSQDAVNGELLLGDDTQNSVAITFADCEDEFGNALNTSAKIAQYLRDNR